MSALGSVSVTDPFDLARFVAAQDEGGVYAAAIRELRAGEKRSHWMWFVFPQIAGLGRSPTARHYAIASIDEARAYLAHPVLGPRLRESAEAVVAAAERGRTAEQIFGGIDAMKLRSSMTLFARSEADEPAFLQVIRLLFDGRFDSATDERLAGED